jgi:predicted 3-demethylubiquinone-9 3-methyltransferase (glyoxalase superfamily)
MPTIVPFLWYDGAAEEAATLYTSLFPDSRVDAVNKTPDGQTTVVEFTLLGQPYRAMDGGPDHPHSDAISFQVDVETQEELDKYWDALSAGGREVACGWLADKWGVSWQITPAKMGEWMSVPDQDRAAKVFSLMMDMVKIDLNALRDAAEGR